MSIFNHSRILKDFTYYFGKQWRFKCFSAAQPDFKELEYRHLCSYSHVLDNDFFRCADLYEMRDGTKVLRFQLSVPTFDVYDRISDSWRRLYLFAGEKWTGTDGIYAAGGYKLAFAAAAHDLLAFPRELEELSL